MEILTDLHVLNRSEYEGVISEIPSVCLYVWVYVWAPRYRLNSWRILFVVCFLGPSWRNPVFGGGICPLTGHPPVVNKLLNAEYE
jgi:hypothetical protein